ncbi:MAG: type II toxin-antitoxin system PemK/MazF family toxin [Propionibacteriaceae bacterium]|nr:type II toxin-antitoxin system PemK/MazF family toxin [Propionibacteriaceae bacterium]
MFQFGDVVLAAGGTYSSKPRPVLVFQNQLAPTGDSTVVIPFTSENNPAIPYRVAVSPTEQNGLDRPCWLEVDKVSAIRTSWLGETVGVLEEQSQMEAIGLSRRLLSPAG